jgi:hypothetical protein
VVGIVLILVFDAMVVLVATASAVLDPLWDILESLLDDICMADTVTAVVLAELTKAVVRRVRVRVGKCIVNW